MKINYDIHDILPIEIADKLRELLEHQPAISAAYLHGSRVKGRQRPDSDMDIALLPAGSVSPSQRTILELAADMSVITGCEVDIGLLSHDNLIYAKEVVESGIPIIEKEPFPARIFHATTLSMYCELQTARREVVDAYSA